MRVPFSFKGTHNLHYPTQSTFSIKTHKFSREFVIYTANTDIGTANTETGTANTETGTANTETATANTKTRKASNSCTLRAPLKDNGTRINSLIYSLLSQIVYAKAHFNIIVNKKFLLF